MILVYSTITSGVICFRFLVILFGQHLFSLTSTMFFLLRFALLLENSNKKIESKYQQLVIYTHWLNLIFCIIYFISSHLRFLAMNLDAFASTTYTILTPCQWIIKFSFVFFLFHVFLLHFRIWNVIEWEWEKHQITRLSLFCPTIPFIQHNNERIIYEKSMNFYK